MAAQTQAVAVAILGGRNTYAEKDDAAMAKVAESVRKGAGAVGVAVAEVYGRLFFPITELQGGPWVLTLRRGRGARALRERGPRAHRRWHPRPSRNAPPRPLANARRHYPLPKGAAAALRRTDRGETASEACPPSRRTENGPWQPV